ncbi:hypothetical protein DFH07DRAFT_893615 [Mycena maculata]|uniref:Uncharacterized protein n=1 Tax=Mycena maculata TaxID=230809 RepID=A0AAD7I608_9AGAR|nr:hypothetical protein DFH07DRAFT_893615 [Mycena maculata]
MEAPPPVSVWKKSAQLAKESIEKHFDAHEQYLSARGGDRNHVPSLVDLVAERLGNLSLDDEDTMDDIPPVILASYIWGWHKIAYPAMRRALQRLPTESTAEGSSKTIDEWNLSNEKWLRDGNQTEWQQGLVKFSDFDNVYPNSVLGDVGRTITRPAPLPGYELLCEARESQITIQPSVEAFKRTFEHISDGLLKNLDWSNLLVAGGIVLGTLLSVDAADGQPRCDPRWVSSDIDMYVHGLSALEANEKIKHVFETFRANLPPGTPTLAVRNCTTITLYARYPLRRIQIVLKLTESPKSVLLNFDLDVCAMGWDGSALWMLPRAARALETGCNVFTMSLIHGHYLSNRRASTQERIFKYADKGYGLRILPSYISSLAKKKPSRPKSGKRSGASKNLHVDIPSLGEEEREWTTIQVRRKSRYSTVRLGLDSLLPPHAGYRRSRCLIAFRNFMRCVALWEMAQRKEVTLQENIWASTSYEDAMTTYDDVPLTSRYKWNARFDLAAFQRFLGAANATEIADWVDTDYDGRLTRHGVDDSGDLPAFQRTVCASTVDALLGKKMDIVMQVLLPCTFAVYANDMVAQAQARAGLRETKLLAPVVRGFDFLGSTDPQADGLFFWRIGAEMMWQQSDRSIDEISEVLYAFRRVNEHLRDGPYCQERRLRDELARRKSYDELDAFGRWVRAGEPAPFYGYNSDDSYEGYGDYYSEGYEL